MVKYPMQRIAVTAGFGMYDPFGTRTMHYAIDITGRQPASRDVSAAHAGTVVMSTFDSAGGNMLALLGYFNEQKDILTRYAHLENRNFKKGETVKQGDALGRQGNTGSATTARHLHFETWIVPKNYVYSFSDRKDYAVDPLSICQLTGEQEFLSDAKTGYFEAIPWPEPGVELKAYDGARLHITGEPAMYFYPSRRYSPYVAGYDRCKKSIADFFFDDSFDCRFTCENEGETWAYIATARGYLWVPVESGKCELLLAESPAEAEKPSEQDNAAAYLAALRTIKNAVEAAGV